MALAWRSSVVALLLAICVHVYNDFVPMDAYLPPTAINTTVEENFVDNYYQARALFRQRAKDAGATLHTLPFEHLSHLDLTMDIAVVEGVSENVFVHISGTHGVEGFAGSAIQAALLKRAKSWKKSGGPTVILVHALNAYGFSQLRRFNENNVDLNRNWLPPKEFAELMKVDLNTYGYGDLYDFLNPPVEPAWKSVLFWPRAAYYIATVGMSAIKQALVSGNYQHPESVYYGGQEMQPSLKMLKQFLEKHVSLKTIKHLAVVDVHTGLGRAGVDTLVLLGGTNNELASRTFAEEKASKNLVANTDSSNDVADGYATVVGFVGEGIGKLVPADRQDNMILLFQEFGTVPGIFVFKATNDENAYFNHAPSRRLPFAEKIRDVFYVHRSFSWKQSVLERGLAVFYKVYTELSL
ncbi:hypothetical protein Poli38472_013872 [Pythium oligandrum]|uniref:Uncharacterized protein n=1 Tax=Pythium oligandrum TaxID=41045 RepID=A0A8K1F9D8_PYTOL|nr:hypothetical protein Poli38472_013872 [Pythium oligandrum]|eukprot:TMW55110.1 hypothetical protein Poli38472_013872 [Pythium oligandrum]